MWDCRRFRCWPVSVWSPLSPFAVTRWRPQQRHDTHRRQINSRPRPSACCPTYESINILQKAIAGSFYCLTVARQLPEGSPINQLSKNWPVGRRRVVRGHTDQAIAVVVTTRPNRRCNTWQQRKKVFVILWHPSQLSSTHRSVVSPSILRLYAPHFVWFNVLSIIGTVHYANNWANQTKVKMKKHSTTFMFLWFLLSRWWNLTDVPTFLFIILNVRQTSTNLFTWGDILFLPNQWRLGRQR